MPFTRIDLLKGKPDDYRTTIGDVVYEGLTAIMGAPDGDHFSVVTEHDAKNFIYDKMFLNMPRSSELIFIQLYTTVGDTTEQKRAFFKHVANGLHERLGVRLEDVFINIVIEAKENWSFGKGEPWI